MAEGEYTLKIASGLSQDISPLTIALFQIEGLPAEPETFDSVIADRFTPAQVPLYTGSKRGRLVWNVAAVMTIAQSRKLGALYQWQQNRSLNQLDARLTWIDEYYHIDPQATPTRALVTSLTSEDGQTYGYPVVDCLLGKPLREIRNLPAFQRDLYPHLCTFQVTEVRSA